MGLVLLLLEQNTRLTHTPHFAAASQTAVLAGALGNSLTTQEYKENKEKAIL